MDNMSWVRHNYLFLFLTLLGAFLSDSCIKEVLLQWYQTVFLGTFQSLISFC